MNLTTITAGLSYHSYKKTLSNREVTLHLTILEQASNPHLTLLISKVSEAIVPQTLGNHVGSGACMEDFLKKQPGVRFLINGGFSHYRKTFYHWPHQEFHVGDPVGLVKIRHHFFEDYHGLEHYGFLTQDHKGGSWKIVAAQELNRNAKYILGCTPLLIAHGAATELPDMTPVPTGQINPPSILGHGLACHPRTAVATKGNYLYFITVEGVAPGEGCTLPELQALGLSLGFDSLLNLDGGGSSQFRLLTQNGFIKNALPTEDQNRVLGHVLVIFDETLK